MKHPQITRNSLKLDELAGVEPAPMRITTAQLPSCPRFPWIPMLSPRAACDIPKSPAEAQLIRPDIGDFNADQLSQSLSGTLLICLEKQLEQKPPQTVALSCSFTSSKRSSWCWWPAISPTELYLKPIDLTSAHVILQLQEHTIWFCLASSVPYSDVKSTFITTVWVRGY